MATRPLHRVVDRGFSSEENLRYLTRGGGHWIAGERMRDGHPDHEAALARQGRYRTVRDNLRVKEVTVGEGDGARRFVVCHNPHEAERARSKRTETIRRLEEELARLERQRQRAKGANTKEAHLRGECALRDHPSLGRYLRQLKDGRLRIDRAKVKAEARLDGKFLLSTSDPDLDAEDVALGNKNLLEAERSFRDLKRALALRPVFHRLEHRIRAHILICWLALLLIRVAERRSDRTWRTIARQLGRLHLVTLAGPAGTACQTTPLTDEQPEILAALEVEPRRGSPRSTPPERALTPQAWRGHTAAPARSASIPPHKLAYGESACLLTAELGFHPTQWGRLSMPGDVSEDSGRSHPSIRPDVAETREQNQIDLRRNLRRAPISMRRVSTVRYLLQLHARDGKIVRTIARETPKGLAAAAHEIMSRGLVAELGDEADLYTGTDGIEYADLEFSFARLERHPLSEAERQELEAELHRLDPETLMSKRQRARGFDDERA